MILIDTNVISAPLRAASEVLVIAPHSYEPKASNGYRGWVVRLARKARPGAAKEEIGGLTNYNPQVIY